VKWLLPALAIVLAVSVVAAASARPVVLKTRPCGSVSIGQGWHVSATRNVRCLSARRLITKFFVLPRCDQARRTPARPCTVNRYLCVESFLASDLSIVRCKQPARLVTAESMSSRFR
jgi:hypothetical protein